VNSIEELAAEVRELRKRVKELEDERAIRELLSRYSYHTDSCKDRELLDLFTDDAVYELGTEKPGIIRSEGREALWQFITNPEGHHNPEKYGRRMHVSDDSFVCHLNGDQAIVNSYSIVLVRDGDNIKIETAGNNEWLVVRENGSWRVKARRRKHIGGPGYIDNLGATPV